MGLSWLWTVSDVHCKIQAHPLVREGAFHENARKCLSQFPLQLRMGFSFLRDCLLQWHREVQCGVFLLERVVAVWELAMTHSRDIGAVQEHIGRGMTTTESRSQWLGEIKADWEDKVFAVVNCRMCEGVTELQLIVITSCTCPINLVSNLNPVYSHSYLWQQPISK
jgi:hypothetical protein